MSNNAVVSLVDRTNSSRHVSPEQCLEDALDDLRTGKRTGVRKCMVLFLDDSDGQYTNGFRNAGMSCSEMVALLTITATDVQRTMRGEN
jgi:hypothetical protein